MGDSLYGTEEGKAKSERLLLHATRLRFKHVSLVSRMCLYALALRAVTHVFVYGTLLYTKKEVRASSLPRSLSAVRYTGRHANAQVVHFKSTTLDVVEPALRGSQLFLLSFPPRARHHARLRCAV